MAPPAGETYVCGSGTVDGAHGCTALVGGIVWVSVSEGALAASEAPHPHLEGGAWRGGGTGEGNSVYF